MKEWLLTAGLDEAEVAIKTAEKNDLNQPEKINSFDRQEPGSCDRHEVCVQEGWDCPFAYVLCSLSASSNLSAMTQLVGRILRQPHALKTGVDALDECYVITHHADTAAVVASIKKKGLRPTPLNGTWYWPSQAIQGQLSASFGRK